MGYIERLLRQSGESAARAAAPPSPAMRAPMSVTLQEQVRQFAESRAAREADQSRRLAEGIQEMYRMHAENPMPGPLTPYVNSRPKSMDVSAGPLVLGKGASYVQPGAPVSVDLPPDVLPKSQMRDPALYAPADPGPAASFSRPNDGGLDITDLRRADVISPSQRIRELRELIDSQNEDMAADLLDAAAPRRNPYSRPVR